MNKKLDRSIDSLDLDLRTYNYLRAEDVTTLDDLLSRFRNESLSRKRLDKKMLYDIVRAVSLVLG